MCHPVQQHWWCASPEHFNKKTEKENDIVICSTAYIGLGSFYLHKSYNSFYTNATCVCWHLVFVKTCLHENWRLAQCEKATDVDTAQHVMYLHCDTHCDCFQIVHGYWDVNESPRRQGGFAWGGHERRRASSGLAQHAIYYAQFQARGVMAVKTAVPVIINAILNWEPRLHWTAGDTVLPQVFFSGHCLKNFFPVNMIGDKCQKDSFTLTSHFPPKCLDLKWSALTQALAHNHRDCVEGIQSMYNSTMK